MSSADFFSSMLSINKAALFVWLSYNDSPSFLIEPSDMINDLGRGAT